VECHDPETAYSIGFLIDKIVETQNRGPNIDTDMEKLYKKIMSKSKSDGLKYSITESEVYLYICLKVASKIIENQIREINCLKNDIESILKDVPKELHYINLGKSIKIL